MTDYKAIKGKTILSLASDLGNAEGEGEIWFNTASGDYKTIIGVGAWASGGDLNAARRGMQGCGTQTAGLCISGKTHPAGGTLASVESYNGSAWTETHDVNTGRNYASTANNAPNTNTIFFSGSTAPAYADDEAETYDGSSWTAVDVLNTGRQLPGGAGVSSTSALCFGGGSPPGFHVETEVWDGTSWTEVGNINNLREAGGGCGTATAALLAGGSGGPKAYVEIWDGTSWTETTDLPQENSYHGAAGTTTLALSIGGDDSEAHTQGWDGTSWTTLASMSVGRWAWNGTAGTGTLALAFGGLSTPEGAGDSLTTEEWSFITTTGPGAQNVKVITD